MFLNDGSMPGSCTVSFSFYVCANIKTRNMFNLLSTRRQVTLCVPHNLIKIFTSTIVGYKLYILLP